MQTMPPRQRRDTRRVLPQLTAHRRRGSDVRGRRWRSPARAERATRESGERRAHRRRCRGKRQPTRSARLRPRAGPSTTGRGRTERADRAAPALPSCRYDRRAPRRVRTDRHAQQRQAAARNRVRRHRCRQLFPLLRRLGDQAARPDLRRAGALADLHGARADRRLRADRPVELPAADGACGSSRRRWPRATSASSSPPN